LHAGVLDFCAAPGARRFSKTNVRENVLFIPVEKPADYLLHAPALTSAAFFPQENLFYDLELTCEVR
jgi:hypothetical protein